MALTYTQKKILVFIKNRLFTDMIAWVVLYGVIIGVLMVDLWRKSEGVLDSSGKAIGFTDFVTGQAYADEAKGWFAAFQIILRDSFLILLGLMFVTYFNLKFLKQRLLNKYLTKWQRVGWYISSVIILSLVMALVWVQVDQWLGQYFRPDIHFVFASIVNFCIAILSTGMLTIKELTDARTKVNELRSELNQIKTQQLAKKEELTFYTNHIKVGSRKKWQIIPYDDIYFFKGGGNDPQIFMKNGRVWGSSKLEEYDYFLPSDKFIRVHRSYIIAKERVRERDGNLLYLVDAEDKFLCDNNGERIGIPISESYVKNVEEDSFLQFFQESPRVKQ